MNAPEFDQMVFAGGGNRCWWQAGWWDVVQPELGLAPRVIAGISAGASTACMLHAWNSAELMDYYGEALRQNTRNAHWGNLLRGERVFPHYGMYRTALLTVFSEGRFGRLAQAPEIRIDVEEIDAPAVGDVLMANRLANDWFAGDVVHAGGLAVSCFVRPA